LLVGHILFRNHGGYESAASFAGNEIIMRRSEGGNSFERLKKSRF
jgi:hypothetical protein